MPDNMTEPFFQFRPQKNFMGEKPFSSSYELSNKFAIFPVYGGGQKQHNGFESSFEPQKHISEQTKESRDHRLVKVICKKMRMYSLVKIISK